MGIGKDCLVLVGLNVTASQHAYFYIKLLGCCFPKQQLWSGKKKKRLFAAVWQSSNSPIAESCQMLGRALTVAPGAVMEELRCCKPCLREGRGSEQRPQVAKVPLKDWVALSRKGDTSFGRIRAGKGNLLNQCMSSCCLCICPLKLSCF